jgi:hypothetical protein
MKGDFWMKTRKLAAKALSVAVIATTVSGYAMAGDHSMTADLSYVPWCTKSLDVDDTLDSFGGSGSCAAPDAQINFSGKLADKWTYSFNLDFSEVKESALGLADVPGHWGDVMSSIALTGDLGGGLTLSLGDTGDGDRLKNYAGHWELVEHANPDSAGGVKVAYGKGNLDASLVLGGLRGKGDDDAALGSDISVGAGFKFGKFDVGASYHTQTYSDVVKKYGINKTAAANGRPLTSNSMAFGAGGSFGNFNVGVDYLMKTAENCASAGGSGNDCADAAFATTETAAMGAHLWASSGVFRPGVSFTSETANTSLKSISYDNSKVKETKMGAGVSWHPTSGFMSGLATRFDYTSTKKSTESCTGASTCAAAVDDAGNGSQIRIKISKTVTII